MTRSLSALFLFVSLVPRSLPAGPGQEKPLAAAGGETVVAGKIAGNTASTLVIGSAEVAIDGSGAFQQKFDIAGPEFLTVRYQGRRFQVFCEPGERLEVTFAAADLAGTIAFQGVSAAANRYLFGQAQTDERLGPYYDTSSSEWTGLFRREEKDFIAQIDSLKGLYLIPLQKLVRGEPGLNRTFLFRTQRSVDFSFGWLVLHYPEFHQRLTGRVVRSNKAVQQGLDALMADDPALIPVAEYALFGKDYLVTEIGIEFDGNPALRKSDNQWLRAAFNVVARRFKNRALLDFWRGQFLKNQIELDGVKNLGPFFDIFDRECQSGSLKAEVDSLYENEMKNHRDHPVMTYKTVDGFALDAHVFIPAQLGKDALRPALVYFHGGSWNEGKPDYNFGYSKLGFVSICIEYRTHDRYHVLPFAAIADAKSAIRWVRQHAVELHVDQDKIIACGNSAGGHLALCTAMLDSLDETSEDLKVSSRPDALILNSAVYDCTDTWFADKVVDKKKIQAISPLQLIRKGLPPMLVFHGTADLFSSPYSQCQRFVTEMKAAGNDVDFHPIEGVGHAIWASDAYWQVSGPAQRAFWARLGYL